MKVKNLTEHWSVRLNRPVGTAADLAVCLAAEGTTARLYRAELCGAAACGGRRGDLYPMTGTAYEAAGRRRWELDRGAELTAAELGEATDWAARQVAVFRRAEEARR